MEKGDTCIDKNLNILFILVAQSLFSCNSLISCAYNMLAGRIFLITYLFMGWECLNTKYGTSHNNLCLDVRRLTVLPFLDYTVLQKNTQYILAFDGFVILSCFASLILCTRSIVLAMKLQKVSSVLIISMLALSVVFCCWSCEVI